MENSSPIIIKSKRIFIFVLGSTLLLLFVNRVVHTYCAALTDRSESVCPPYWPLSEFSPRTPSLNHILVAIILAIIFHIIVQNLNFSTRSITVLVSIGVVLVLGSNLIQGWSIGFHVPMARGGDQGDQYLHDAMKITDPILFIKDFEKIQPNLKMHSRTHPPGAVISIFLLYRLLKEPSFISVAIAIIATSLSIYFLYKILGTELKEERLARIMSLLFIAIPAVQIYFAASIDALVACGILGTLYFFTRTDNRIAIIGAAFMMFLSSTLSYSFAFILPGLFVYEILSRKSILRLFLSLSIVGIFYLAIYFLLGFSYYGAYSIATEFVGFREPALSPSYILTRLEDVAELLVFLGPFLLFFFIRSLRLLRISKEPLLVASITIILTLLTFFLTGLFDTGETARIALFIFAFFIIPIAFLFKNCPVSTQDEKRLLWLVMGQTIIMQLIGLYYW